MIDNYSSVAEPGEIILTQERQQLCAYIAYTQNCFHQFLRLSSERQKVKKKVKMDMIGATVAIIGTFFHKMRYGIVENPLNIIFILEAALCCATTVDFAVAPPILRLEVFERITQHTHMSGLYS